MSHSRRYSPDSDINKKTKASFGSEHRIKVSCETIDLLQELQRLGVSLKEVVERERERHRREQERYHESLLETTNRGA